MVGGPFVAGSDREVVAIHVADPPIGCQGSLEIMGLKRLRAMPIFLRNEAIWVQMRRQRRYELNQTEHGDVERAWRSPVFGQVRESNMDVAGLGRLSRNSGG